MIDLITRSLLLQNISNIELCNARPRKPSNYPALKERKIGVVCWLLIKNYQSVCNLKPQSDRKVCRKTLFTMGNGLNTSVATCPIVTNGSRDWCSPLGKCAPDATGVNRTICSCAYYYTPGSFCKNTYFEEEPGDWVYILVAFILGVFIPGILYGLSMASKFKLHNGRFRDFIKIPTIWISFMVMLYSICTFIDLVIRIYSYAQENMTAMLGFVAMRLLAVFFINVDFPLAAIFWMRLLVKAKSLGLSPLWLKIAIGPLVMLTLGLLTAVVSSFLSFSATKIGFSTLQAGIADKISKYITIPCTMLPLVIVGGVNLATAIRLRKAFEKGSSSKKKIKIIINTIVLSIESVIVFIYCLYLILTPQVLSQRPETIMMRNTAAMVEEFVIIVCLWFFVSDYANPVTHWRILRGLESGSTSSTSSTSTGSSSQNKSNSKPSHSTSSTEMSTA